MNIHDHTKALAGQSNDDDRLYLAVRAAFVAQGISLNTWCLANGISRPYAVQVLRGYWTGPKARALRKKIIQAAGIEG